MEGSRYNLKRILWTVTEGLLALLLCAAPMVKTSTMGYTFGFGYLTMLGTLFHITSIGGIGSVSGEEWWIFLVYTLILTGVIALCVVMAVKAWKGRGRILYLVGNALAFLLTLMVAILVKSLGRSLMGDDTELIRVGFGYWAAMLLAIVGFVLGILKLAGRWTDTGREKADDRERPSGSEMRERKKRFEPETGSHVRKPAWEDDIASPFEFEKKPDKKRTVPSAETSVFRGETDALRSKAAEKKPGGYGERMRESSAADETATEAGRTKREPESAVKVKYNMKNSGETSEFFHRDDELS